MVCVKGLMECIVIMCYVFWNVFILIMMIIVFDLGGFISGVVFIEMVFVW